MWGRSFLPTQRMPPPRRLTVEELMGYQFDQPAEAPPSPYDSLEDLTPEERKGARMNSVWSGLAALSTGMGTGQWGRAAQGGIQDIRANEQDAIDQANARQQAEYEQRAKAAEQQAAVAKKKQGAEALLGMYERVTTGESPDGAFSRRMEAAARAGNMSELAKGEEEKPSREAARARGLDPDAWDAIASMKADMAAETERINKKKEWEEVERGKLEEQEKIKAQADLEARIAQRQAGVLWEPRETPAEAAAKAEAVERVRAKFSTAQGGGVKGSLYKQGEQIVFAIPPDKEHPKGQIIPLDGQPETVGNISYFTLPGGVRMAQRKDHPEWGAFEVPQPQPGDPDYDANRRKVLGLDGGGGPTRQGAPQPSGDQGKRYPQDQANVLLQATVEDLMEGASEADALAQLRRRGNVQGFTPEQILQRAKQLAAAKRGR